LLMTMWPSRSGPWRLTAPFTRGGCRLFFIGGADVYKLVVNVWKNKSKHLGLEVHDMQVLFA
jgi:hypothetical protein